MQILIADNFPPPHQRALTDLGHHITFAPDLQGEPLAAALTGIEILIVRGSRVDAAAIAAGDKLRLIIRAGAGTNAIDTAAAKAAGVRVCNVPGANAVAVAELVFALILAIDRQLAGNITDLRAGHWRKKLYGAARGLHGQTLGILGLGAIGRAVAARAHAFGMPLITPLRDTARSEARTAIREFDITEATSLPNLAAASDIITLHLPLTDATRALVGRDFLAAMKPGAMLINTARGELVDEAALIAAMDDNGIRAGLDVYQNEPPTGHADFASPLAAHGAVCGTHHIGASTEQAQTAVADGVLRVVAAFQQDELLHCVNP